MFFTFYIQECFLRVRGEKMLMVKFYKDNCNIDSLTVKSIQNLSRIICTW